MTDVNELYCARHLFDKRTEATDVHFIERCIRLWSNPGETVFTPFAGIGSEVYMARSLGRVGFGIELKPSYWQTAVENLTTLDTELSHATLFDVLGA